MIELWQRNISALKKMDPGLAERLSTVAPHPAVQWQTTRQDELLTASVGIEGEEAQVSLASRYRPLEEARRLADTAELKQHAVLVVMGLGLGYHVAELAGRAKGKALLVVYEPDERWLRALLEKVDCTRWLAADHVALLCGEVDSAAMTRRLQAAVAMVSQGVQFITHPPTRRLHGERLARFGEQMTHFVAFCRTNIATTFVNAPATCRNLAHNLAQYAAGPIVGDLRDRAKGCPALLIAAGPSLARNIDQLVDPDLRRRIVIITAQTMLKPLLARGIRPHYVTALDYHEISRRFYEDLPPLDDVTLVAEPKANKAIIDQYPGPVRMVASRFLDVLLGPVARPVGELTAGSTVAHLSFYLAQYLGCDPIIFVGQDLGFSDGLYYCPGTAIHQVWANELSTFNTLEMMEWRRIVRHRIHLQKMDDIHGRPIYTDEQMVTYLRQFERDFAEAPQTIIDATEGGLPKQHTQRMALCDALAQHATRELPEMSPAGRTLDPARLRNTADHLRHRIAEVRKLGRHSRQTLPLLQRMLDSQHDRKKMRRLFEQVERHREQVDQLKDAFMIVNDLNQVGAFNRIRRDRDISLADEKDELERQRRQLERDIENVRWLADACDEALDIFEEAQRRINLHFDADGTPVPGNTIAEAMIRANAMAERS
jgi:hypothetical protein